MRGEVVNDIHKDDDTQLDLVWMGSAISKGSGAFGMDLALLRCCRRLDDKRFAIVSRRSAPFQPSRNFNTPHSDFELTVILYRQRRDPRDFCARGLQSSRSATFGLLFGEHRTEPHSSDVRAAAGYRRRRVHPAHIVPHQVPSCTSAR